MNNTELWDSVEKTDPKFTKKVNQRGGFTAIGAQYQMRKATESFGPYGIGWGVKEGPLTHRFNCGDYNDDHIRRNNLYLQWSELGKTPLEYWRNQEPNDQARLNTLAKPHITFRAKFSNFEISAALY